MIRHSQRRRENDPQRRPSQRTIGLGSARDVEARNRKGEVTLDDTMCQQGPTPKRDCPEAGCTGQRDMAGITLKGTETL